VKVTGTALELVSVTVCGGETVPTWTLPNESEVGDRVGVIMKPEPETGTVCVGIYALSVTVIFPVLLPVCAGVNITEKLQVPPAGTWVPLQVSLLTVNSPLDEMTLVTLRGTRFGLVKTTVFVALGTCTGSRPKLR